MSEPSPRRVEALFDQALDLDPARLPTFLEEQCGGDAGLRAVVGELLQLDRRAEATEHQLRGPVAEARRPVALKVIRPGLVGPASLKRFAREAQILGLLHHPGVAPIYLAGPQHTPGPASPPQCAAGSGLPPGTSPPPRPEDEAGPEERAPGLPRLQHPARGRRLARPADRPASPLTPTQRLLVLDAWRRSGLPAGDFAPLVSVSKHTLYAWKRKFEAEGPAGLDDRPRGAPTGSRLPEPTRRAILMLKEANPDWGCERFAALLLRGPALAASPQSVARVLREAGYELQEAPTRPHPDHPRHFERARSNQLWQTDLFTFGKKKGDSVECHQDKAFGSRRGSKNTGVFGPRTSPGALS